MEKIPFTSYDFWAYLSAGLLLLALADYIAGTGYLGRASWTFMQGAVAVISAYVVGQLVASLSSALLESVLVKRFLGFPRNVLFGHSNAPKALKTLLSGYFRALPTETQLAALRRAKAEGIESHGEALFWAAYAKARCNPVVMSRLDNFLNLYGFSRNIAVVAAIYTVTLASSHYALGRPYTNVVLAAMAAVAGIGMLLRYLKFFRAFAVEVLTSYAYPSDK